MGGWGTAAPARFRAGGRLAILGARSFRGTRGRNRAPGAFRGGRGFTTTEGAASPLVRLSCHRSSISSSDERRVGKECRCGRGLFAYTKDGWSSTIDKSAYGN